MKKKLFIMALFLIVMTIVATGCGKGDQASSDKADSLSDSVKVAVYKGTSSQVVKNLGKDYTVKEYDNLLNLEKAVERGAYDVAVMPTTDADWLYGKTGRELKILSPVSMGGLYLLSNNYVLENPKMSNFVRKTIYVTGERSTGAKVFEYLMMEAGIGSSSYKIKVLDSYEEVEKAINDYGNFAIVEQPFAKKYLKNRSVVKVMDLEQAWKKATDLELPMDVLVCSKEFYKNRSDDVSLVLADYEKATEKVAGKSGRPVFYGASNRGCSLVKAFNKEIVKNVPGLFNGKDGSKIYYLEK